MLEMFIFKAIIAHAVETESTEPLRGTGLRTHKRGGSMKRITSVCIAVVTSGCLTAVALGESNGQAVKEKNVARTVSEVSSTEKMLPAPEVQLKRLTKGLNLTVEQQKQIKPMLVEEYSKLKEIRQDENLNPKQIQAKVETLRNETVARMQSVMTPEQKEKYEIVRNEIRENKQKRMRENRKSRVGIQPDPPPQPAK
jgi:hypothetical protein